MEDFWKDAPVISAYSRRQAIADGVLKDITEYAAQLGFTIPVAITSEAWAESVSWPAAAGFHQNEPDRIRDLLRAAHRAVIAACHSDVTRVPVKTWRIPAAEPKSEPQAIELHLQIGPGDTILPVVTIMLPEQD